MLQLECFSIVFPKTLMTYGLWCYWCFFFGKSTMVWLLMAVIIYMSILQWLKREKKIQLKSMHHVIFPFTLGWKWASEHQKSLVPRKGGRKPIFECGRNVFEIRSGHIGSRTFRYRSESLYAATRWSKFRTFTFGFGSNLFESNFCCVLCSLRAVGFCYFSFFFLLGYVWKLFQFIIYL